MKIIAEVGSNWKTLDDCLKSVELARKAGAHAVKFQLFSGYELYGPSVDIMTFAHIGKTPYMNRDWIKPLAQLAWDKEIEFMCTGFSVDGYQYLDPFVQTHKIASAEMTDTNILKTVNSFKKPVVLSTAGSDPEDIRHALSYLKDCPVTIMFCVGDYPARIVDFRKLRELKVYFGSNYSYGYSDHSIDVLNIPIMARANGACVLEKHVNFNGHKDTADAPHSLNFEEFALMTRVLMGEDVSVAEVDLHTEHMMKRLYKRKFIVTKDIKAGEKFKFNDNVYIYRPQSQYANPISTFRQLEMDGKVANRDKYIGEVVCFDDIEIDH